MWGRVKSEVCKDFAIRPGYVRCLSLEPRSEIIFVSFLNSCIREPRPRHIMAIEVTKKTSNIALCRPSQEIRDYNRADSSHCALPAWLLWRRRYIRWIRYWRLLRWRRFVWKHCKQKDQDLQIINLMQIIRIIGIIKIIRIIGIIGIIGIINWE